MTAAADLTCRASNVNVPRRKIPSASKQGDGEFGRIFSRLTGQRDAAGSLEVSSAVPEPNLPISPLPVDSIPDKSEPRTEAL
jgi:hypothetical protein